MHVFLNDRLKFDGEFDWVPETKEIFNEVLTHLYSILDSFQFYSDVNLYYSSVDMGLIFENFLEINDIVNGDYQHKIDLLRIKLQDILATDWQQNQLQPGGVNYFYQVSPGHATYDVTNSSLAEATEYLKLGNKVFVIDFVQSEFLAYSPLQINRSKVTPPTSMEMFALDSVHVLESFAKYVINHRVEFVYTHNLKHGENGKNVLQNKGEDVSPLEGSIDEATQLLKFAVSYNGIKRLYVFDKTHNKFIEYKFDNAGGYHGYHPKDQSEIPNKVKDFLTSIQDKLTE